MGLSSSKEKGDGESNPVQVRVRHVSVLKATCMNDVEALKKRFANHDDRRNQFLLLDTDTLGNTSFHCAAMCNCVEALQVLVQQKPIRVREALAECDAKYGYTCLHMAVMLQRKEIVDCLVQACDTEGKKLMAIECETKQHFTALHLCIMAGLDELVQILLNAGASVEATATHGLSPLQLALKYKRYRIARRLLKHGALMRRRDFEGNNPAHTLFDGLKQARSKSKKENQAKTEVPAAAAAVPPSPSKKERSVSDSQDLKGDGNQPKDKEPSSWTWKGTVADFSDEAYIAFRDGLHSQLSQDWACHYEKNLDWDITELDSLITEMLQRQDQEDDWICWVNKKGKMPIQLLEEVMKRKPNLCSPAVVQAFRIQSQVAIQNQLASLPSSKSKKDEEAASLPFRMQICSDLHIEFYDEENKDYQAQIDALIDPSAKYLGLLGDIGLICMPSYRKFLLDMAHRFKGVYVILGNHEYYKSTAPGGLRKVKAICEEHENLHLAYRASFVVQNVRIIGVSLWANIPDHLLKNVEYRMNDYRMIGAEDDDETGLYQGREKKPLNPTITTAWHKEDVAYVRAELAKAKELHQTALVLSHHAPLDLQSYSATRPGEWHMDFAHANGTDLRDMFQDPLHTWAYGHTHWYGDITLGSTRVVSNPRGYPKESLGYDSKMVIEIGPGLPGCVASEKILQRYLMKRKKSKSRKPSKK